MFTGIVEETTSDYCIVDTNTLQLSKTSFFDGVAEGDSISVSGVCLTVDHYDLEHVYFILSQETLSRVVFNKTLNLEKAMVYNTSRLGGHCVSGHVHHTATIEKIDEDEWTFALDEKITPQLQYKGSVTVEGISLTVCKINNTNSFTVALIPKTLQKTNLSTLRVNDTVNVEFDTNSKKTDDEWMEYALHLSLKGRATTSPNPHVGCVIVRDNVIISEGYHVRAGEAHAERIAIGSFDEHTMCENVTLYVTLEPCHHVGRTGRCDELIVSSGIKRVVVGILDPDTRVSGQGVEYLRSNGVEVVVLNDERVRDSLRAYIHHRITNTPYVIAKIAESLDGCYALPNGDSKWITCASSRQHSHSYLRAYSDVIVVGSETFLLDSPSLTARNEDGSIIKNPIKVVMDRRNRINESANNDFVVWNKSFEELLDYFSITAIQILVEGGPTLIASLIQFNVVDELWIYTGSKVLGKYSKRWTASFPTPPSLLLNTNVQLKSVEQIDTDTLRTFRVHSKKGNLNSKREFSNIQDALNAFARGEFVIVMDDESRENEGDLIVAAEDMTVEQMTLLIEMTSGIVCCSLPQESATRLQLPPMVVENTDNHQTAFTVSCDAIDAGTGVSALNRLRTIKALLDGDPSRLRRPGHIFPLVAKSGGLQERRGHTEAAYDLCRMTHKKYNISVIGELKNGGEMMRFDECWELSQAYHIPIIHIDQLSRRESPRSESPQSPLNFTQSLSSSFEKVAECPLHLQGVGEWTMQMYPGEHKVLIKGNVQEKERVVVRIHSECFTGDVLQSEYCDCGPQLRESLRYIHSQGSGVIIMPTNHEGRGIGLVNKVRAYALIQGSNKTIDTYEANRLLGFADDLREYDDCARILHTLNVSRIELLTSNPLKVNALTSHGLDVIMTPLIVGETAHNTSYLQAKRDYHNIYPEKKLLNQLKVTTTKENIKVAIVRSQWHHEILTVLHNDLNFGCNVTVDSYIVPGALELVIATQKILLTKNYDCVLWLGVLIKGDTAHFEYVSKAVIEGLNTLQLRYNVPIIDGVLNCYTLDQARERCLGGELAATLSETVKYMANECYLV